MFTVSPCNSYLKMSIFFSNLTTAKCKDKLNVILILIHKAVRNEVGYVPPNINYIYII